MSKKVAFTPKPISTVPAHADDWVSGEKPKAKKEEEKEPMKRLTLDIREPLHRRVKRASVDRGMEMAEMLRLLLEKEYPE
ncbi:MAG: hypothetical protein ACJ74Z_22285 [Bryobacteraceae bacterium]|jgi:hypothetical protein